MRVRVRVKASPARIAAHALVARLVVRRRLELDHLALVVLDRGGGTWCTQRGRAGETTAFDAQRGAGVSDGAPTAKGARSGSGTAREG